MKPVRPRLARLAGVLALMVVAAVPLPAGAQSRDGVEKQFRAWLQNDVWPEAKTSGIARKTFEEAAARIRINWDLPDLVPPGTKPSKDRKQSQAEFSSPAPTSPKSACRGSPPAVVLWRRPMPAC